MFKFTIQFFVTFRCCDDPKHCTNFTDPDYLPTILADLKKLRDIVAKEIPAAGVLDIQDIIMGPGKKDGKMKEEAIRTHWSTDPVHANLHTYYKLASNLMDFHKNFKVGKAEKASVSKRPRSNSSITDGEEGSASSNNLLKRKKDDHKGRTSGSHKDFRHWPPAGPTYQQDRGYGYQQNLYEDRYGQNSYGHRNMYRTRDTGAPLRREPAAIAAAAGLATASSSRCRFNSAEYDQDQR